MPAEDRFWLKYPDEVTQLVDGSVGALLHLGDEHGQGQLFDLCGLEWCLQFTFGEVQWIASDHDFKVFFLVGQSADANQLDEG